MKISKGELIQQILDHLHYHVEDSEDGDIEELSYLNESFIVSMMLDATLESKRLGFELEDAE